MDPILKVLSEVRPLQNFRDINARLLAAGADFTIEHLFQSWPESVPRFGIFMGDSGVIRSVIYTQRVEGLRIDGIEVGDDFETISKRYPTLEHRRRQDRKDGTYVDVYVLDAGQVVQHQISVESSRVTFHRFAVEADSETRIRLFDEARNETPFREIWAARTHGFIHRGELTDQLYRWAAAYRGDFHGNDWSELAEWLTQRSSPSDRHAFARAYNWDHGVLPLAWIAAQPDTCLATIAEIFWLAEPGYYEDHRRDPKHPVDTDVFDLLWDIRGIARARSAPDQAPLPMEFSFDPGTSASAYASEDPETFFVPLLCHPISGGSPEQLPENWPIPII